jgi:hypothetical protein
MRVVRRSAFHPGWKLSVKNPTSKPGGSPSPEPLPGQTSFLELTRPSDNGDPAGPAPGDLLDGLTTPTAGAPPAPPPPDDDPFDPDRLRLSQDFATAVGVRKVLTTVPVRKPSREWFVRTHPDPAYWLRTAVLELKEDRETYLVAPELRPALTGEATFSPRLLITAVNRQGVLFLWPLKLPGPDGKLDTWNQSARDAADMARTQWVRVTANMSLGAYEVVTASYPVEPEWPALSMKEILKVAFRDKLISTLDHSVLRQLRGEV